jgi:2',3'-cyclic-nucleotide 2'-phosphodiesterase
MHDNIRVLMLGDVVGAPGRAIFQKYSARLREHYRAQALIVNGENSADGKGITPRIMRFFKHNGADIVTSGNHIWAKREIYSYLQENRDLLRPANFPSNCPGTGVTTISLGAFTLGVINIQARTFMREHVACPFRTAESALTYVKTKTNIIVVDFHGEATSEKMALAYYLDGQISALVGTHTHVQTADARILPAGTAYITDLGMAGSLNSLIGMKKEPLIHQIMSQMPVKFEVETKGPYVLSGVCIEIDSVTGKAVSIERIYIVDDAIQLDMVDDK